MVTLVSLLGVHSIVSTPVTGGSSHKRGGGTALLLPLVIKPGLLLQEASGPAGAGPPTNVLSYTISCKRPVRRYKLSAAQAVSPVSASAG